MERNQLLFYLNCEKCKIPPHCKLVESLNYGISQNGKSIQGQGCFHPTHPSNDDLKNNFRVFAIMGGSSSKDYAQEETIISEELDEDVDPQYRYVVTRFIQVTYINLHLQQSGINLTYHHNVTP